MSHVTISIAISTKGFGGVYRNDRATSAALATAGTWR
jgi:hypothetical protein